MTTKPETPDMGATPSAITMRLTGERVELHGYRIVWLTKLIHSSAFEVFIAFVIILNAASLAMLTLPNLTPDTVFALTAVNSVAYVIYVIELVLRIASYGKKPWRFFRNGWNIFDFIVIGLAPLLREHVAIIRLLRLLRLVRILRFLPEVRVLTTSILKSLPPLISMSVLVALLLFLYAMSGTYLFGGALPDTWGNILLSLESLFALLTLDSFGDYFSAAVGVTPLAIPFFLTFVFIIVFTVLNVLIGIVLHAMDQAREEIANEQPQAIQLALLSNRIRESAADGHLSAEEITLLRAELDALQASLEAQAAVSPTGASMPSSSGSS
jgi:voltage-gated sodium channel